MDELYGSETWLQVLLVTGVIGGGAAFLAGRAIAQTWRPFWHVLVYMAMLGAAVRFVHFALFEATLLSPRVLRGRYGLPPRARGDGLADDACRPNGDAILLALSPDRTVYLAGTRARRADFGREQPGDPVTGRQKPDKMPPIRLSRTGRP